MNTVGGKGSVSAEDLPQFKSFVSENEIEEQKQKRQEEWEKVRLPDQPLEAPEEVYDPRSLYDKLQEQKDAKDLEFHEQFKFKNQVRGIDNEEAKFLELVNDRVEEIEKKREEEDEVVIEELHKAMVTRAHGGAGPSVETSKPAATSNKLPHSNQRKSQSALLLGAVKRKSTTEADEGAAKKMKTSGSSPQSVEPPPTANQPTSSAQSTTPATNQTAQVIGILPGMGNYTDSSDSDSNSSESDVDVSLFKRQITVCVSGNNQNQ